MTGIKIELHRQPSHWSNGVRKAEILGNWTVVPRVGDMISLETIHCEGEVSMVAWLAPDRVMVTVRELANRLDPEGPLEEEGSTNG